MHNRKTKTNTNPSPDPNRYRRRCPDPNARIQKFIHYMAIATFAIAALCDSGLSPTERASVSAISLRHIIWLPHESHAGMSLQVQAFGYLKRV